MFNFNQGWDGYYWRFLCKEFHLNYSKSIKQEWNGLDSFGRLFIWAEQGIGDQILYSSMLNDLNALNIKITISTNKKLIPIFQRSFPELKVIDETVNYSANNYDVHIPIGGLGKIFRGTIDKIQNARSNYLLDNPIKTNSIKIRIQKNNKINCGVSWFSTNEIIGSDKSIPIQKFQKLFELQDINFINLQYGDISQDLDLIKKVSSVSIESIKDIDLYNDVDGLLSIIKACDIVITISNTTAHLSGALGKETLLLLPFSTGKLWYWNDLNGRSLWYPSVKIFKQNTQGNWDSVIEDIKKYMEKKIESQHLCSSGI